MPVLKALITGSCGLIGSEVAVSFSRAGYEITGIDSNHRAVFFGAEGDTAWSLERLRRDIPHYVHEAIDIRDRDRVLQLVEKLRPDVIVHTAAQPSHDRAAAIPFLDFEVNALGTLHLLEAARRHCPESPFIFTSTNKVYGDRPNTIALEELETRWDYADPAYAEGIAETFSIDQSKHSLFGASKVAADILVQEYGRYFQMPTCCLRGGCLTGPNHSGTKLHGFLAYLMKCTVTHTPYTVFGYGGKQVRDNIHSADLIAAFESFCKAPRVGEVYNIGGGRFSNCSMLEAIEICEVLTGEVLDWTYTDTNRIGDHIWWVSDTSRFEKHYPEWRLKYDVPAILKDISDRNKDRWHSAGVVDRVSS